MSEVALVPAAPLLPGPLTCQARAITARLADVFPPSLFQFWYLPGKLDRKIWSRITQGNQPFLGLGYAGWSATTKAQAATGVAKWMLLCAIRRNGSDASRMLGDAQGLGILDFAATAAALLNGAHAATGTVLVESIVNMASELWDDDTAVMGIDLAIKTGLPLAAAITEPSGVNVFEAMAETWNIPTATGSQDIYQSDWNYPNG